MYKDRVMYRAGYEGVSQQGPFILIWERVTGLSDNESMMALTEAMEECFDELVESCMASGKIDSNLYLEYDVKRGLRDANGKGVLTGLTEISDVVSTRAENGVKVSIDGELYYQGYNVESLVKDTENRRFAFEETTYLLLFGQLPTPRQLGMFVGVLASLRELSGQFVRDVIMKAPSENLMNGLQKSVLTLYSYDANPDDTTPSNVLRQSLQLISKLPVIAVYAYFAYRHFHCGDSLMIRPPEKNLSTAENILLTLKGGYTELEARVLDVALILHAEHGGGNNSTFTNHVVTSSGTDTYSAIAASIASLKGPRHGGANLKVRQMFEDIKKKISNWEDEAALETYLTRVLDRAEFDHSGLIYGVGHAVYTLSDPRERILKENTRRLAAEKGYMDEFNLYDRVERIAIRLISQRRRVFKPVCANVDFYSGLMYTILDIPTELFTPLFAISRISGWSAHRLEELVNQGKIIRPAYKYVGHHRDYTSLDDRHWD